MSLPPIAEPRGTPSRTPKRRDLMNVWQFCLLIGVLLLASGMALAEFALFRSISYGTSEESEFDLKSSTLLWLPGLALLWRARRLWQNK